MASQKVFRLHGAGNNGQRYHYLIQKEEQFKDAFIGFMKALGFDEDAKRNIADSFVQEDEWGVTKHLRVGSFHDECMHFENNLYDADVFYGQKHIILLVRVKRASKRAGTLSRERLSRALLRWSEFVPTKHASQSNRRKKR